MLNCKTLVVRLLQALFKLKTRLKEKTVTAEIGEYQPWESNLVFNALSSTANSSNFFTSSAQRGIWLILELNKAYQNASFIS